MEVDALKQRLSKDRPMTTITIQMPENIIEDLKRLAPLLGFSGYQPLTRAYIGQGLFSVMTYRSTICQIQDQTSLWCLL